MKTKLQILFLFVGAFSALPALADQADNTIRAVCLPEKNTVVVEVSYSFEGGGAGEGKLYNADSLPRYVDHKRPFLLCDLGKNKVVSVKVDGSKNPWNRVGENDSINQCFDVDLRVPWAGCLDFSMSMNA